MDINFTGKYKSITNFSWTSIPDFVVITGPNGTGKSQFLDLIYNSITNKQGTAQKATIIGKTIKPDEVTFLKGEWQLQNTGLVSLYTIQQQMDVHYNNFKQGHYRQNKDSQIKMFYAFQEILEKTGKQQSTITKEEFFEYFPEILLEQESQLSQKIGEIFYNYRLSEIELLAQKLSESEIKDKIGERPWIVLKEIISRPLKSKFWH